MPRVAFDNFGGGLDRRNNASMSAANVLYVLNNAYVTTGKKIKKRPCLTRIATLEAGTVGLRAQGGLLNTFYGPGATITHANSLFKANRVQKAADPALTVTKAHYGENFNGYLYCCVEYSDGTTKHHYLDDPGAWAAATAYAVGTFRRPIAANGFRYEVTAIAGTGTSGGAEPAWPTTLGATVIDNPGANQITWTCRNFEVTDVNCPHSKIIAKLVQKIYAASGENVRFCKTADPRNWTAASDAGFLPTGINASGSSTVTALGDFGGDLAVSFSDSLQIWDVYSDPANNALVTSQGGVGTIYANTGQPLSNDLIYLGAQGFRSISLQVLTNNLQDNDVGSPIDALRSQIADSDNPKSIYYPKLGQYVCVNGTRAYVYSFSRTSKISAWSIFDFPITITDIAVLNNELYMRSGDGVYRMDNAAFSDDGQVPLVEVEMFYQDAKEPGILKQFIGFDGVVVGSPTIAFKYDPRNAALVTPYVSISGDMRPGDLYPMELCATSIAPVFRHQLNEDFQLDFLMCHYEKLGAV